MDQRKMREDVAAALINQAEMNSLSPEPFLSFEDIPPLRVRSEMPFVDAAIAAAEPHIRADERRKVLEELYGEATVARENAEEMRDSESHLRWFFAQDWIRAYLEMLP